MQGRQHPPSPLPPQEVMLREGAYQVGPPPLADGASAFKISFYLPHTHTSNAGSSAPTLPRPHPPSGADTLHPPSPGGGEFQRGSLPGRTSPSGRRRCMYFFLSSTHPHIQCRVVSTHPPQATPTLRSGHPSANAGLSAPTLPRPHPPSGADTLHPPSPGGGDAQRGSLPGRTSPSGRRRCMYISPSGRRRCMYIWGHPPQATPTLRSGHPSPSLPRRR